MSGPADVQSFIHISRRLTNAADLDVLLQGITLLIRVGRLIRCLRYEVTLEDLSGGGHQREDLHSFERSPRPRREVCLRGAWPDSSPLTLQINSALSCLFRHDLTDAHHTTGAVSLITSCLRSTQLSLSQTSLRP
jgi:hypothetical protein